MEPVSLPSTEDMDRPEEEDFDIFDLSPDEDSTDQYSNSFADESKGRPRTPALVATHFLEDWHEWDTLSRRWVRYYGADEADILFGQDRELLRKPCSQCATQLESDDRYPRAFDSMMRSQADRPSLSEMEVDDAILFAVQLCRWNRIAQNLYRDQADRPPKWLANDQEEVLEEISDLFVSSSEAARQLRAYRHATLSASWLIRGSSYDPSQEPLIDRLYRRIDSLQAESSTPVLPWHRSEIRFGEDNQVSHALERITETVREMGINHFAEDVRSPDFQPGSATPVGIDSMCLITGDPSKNQPARLGLAIGDGIGPRSSGQPESRAPKSAFNELLQRVKRWLIRYGEPGTLVLIITDTWDRHQFAIKHLPDFKAWRDRGVFSTFAIPAPHGASLSFLDAGM